MKIRYKALVTVLTTLVVICSGIGTTVVVNKDYQNYLAESKCIARFIKYGVERSEIRTNKGKCFVEIRDY